MTYLEEFPLFASLSEEMHSLILLNCDLKTLFRYSVVSRRSLTEIRGNEWFWELKTKKDFQKLWGFWFPLYEDIGPQLMLKCENKWSLTYFFYHEKAKVELISSLFERKLDKARILLKYGADPNTRYKFEGQPYYSPYRFGDTLLMGAYQWLWVDLVPDLLAAGADPSLRDHPCENERITRTTLMRASGYGRKKHFGKLVKYGANPNTQNEKGWTALMYASKCVQERDKIGTIEKLVKLGADVNLRDKEGNNALMIASEHTNLHAVKFLLELSVDPDRQNDKGWTSLMYAARSRCSETTKTLLDAGADPNIRDDDGLTALEICQPLQEKDKDRLDSIEYGKPDCLEDPFSDTMGMTLVEVMMRQDVYHRGKVIRILEEYEN